MTMRLTVTRDVVPFDATHCNMTSCPLFVSDGGGSEWSVRDRYLCAGEELEKDKQDGTSLRSKHCIENAKDTE